MASGPDKDKKRRRPGLRRGKKQSEAWEAGGGETPPETRGSPRTEEWLAVPGSEALGTSPAKGRPSSAVPEKADESPSPVPGAEPLPLKAFPGAKTVRETRKESQGGPPPSAGELEAMHRLLEKAARLNHKLAQEFAKLSARAQAAEKKAVEADAEMQKLHKQLTAAMRRVGSKGRGKTAQSKPRAAPKKAKSAPDRASTADAPMIHVNEATIDDLSALGLSVVESAQLLASRDLRGGFKNLDELDELPGFTPAGLDKLKSRLKV